MKKLINLVAGLAAAVLLCAASVSPCYAGTTVFVSGGGSDAFPCTLAQPCRTIFHAAFAAGNGVIVSCLDAGPYTEAFDIGFSFTLDCRGVVYTGGGSFAITATSSAAVVTFRHVIFDGAAGGGGAVSISGGKVVFENCTFQNFTASPGVAVLVQAAAQVVITDSVFMNNGVAGGGGGINIQPSGGPANVVIERTQLAGNTNGIFANGTGGLVLVEVRYSTISNSAMNGIWAYTTGSVVSIVANHSASDQNGGSGIIAQGANAYVSLNDSTVAWNATGLNSVSGGLILSYKNNVIGGNPIPGVTPVSVSQQ